MRYEKLLILEQENFTEPLTMVHSNRFNSYYKLLTDSSTDILQIFFDAIRNDKDDFCNYYNKHLRYNKDHSAKYYFQEKYYMDKICDCVLLSYNKNLRSKLDIIRSRDQMYRDQKEIDWEKQQKLDSLNQLDFYKIVQEYGYPNRSLVGLEYQDHLFYVLQHSNLEMMKKYIDLIKSEVDKRQISPHLYPLIYDRIKMLEGKPQKYGTQYIKDKDGKNILYKTLNKLTLNEERARYGLQPIKLK